VARDGWGDDQSPPWEEKGGQKPNGLGEIGTKRSLLTDGGGVPVGLAVEGANRNDFKMARETIESIPVKRPQPTPSPRKGYAWTKVMTMTRCVTC
jgi:putative transposase